MEGCFYCQSDRARNCTSKLYKTPDISIALAVARGINEETNFEVMMGVYRCIWCDQYHLTSGDTSRSKIKEMRKFKTEQEWKRRGFQLAEEEAA